VAAERLATCRNELHQVSTDTARNVAQGHCRSDGAPAGLREALGQQN
jgi:hypothetical protein